MQGIGAAAKAAARQLAFASTEQKNRALLAAASALTHSRARILAANEADIRESGADLSAAQLDRLRLDDARIAAMARGLADVAAARDPTCPRLAEWSRPNGMLIQRVWLPFSTTGGL